MFNRSITVLPLVATLGVVALAARTADAALLGTRPMCMSPTGVTGLHESHVWERGNSTFKGEVELESGLWNYNDMSAFPALRHQYPTNYLSVEARGDADIRFFGESFEIASQTARATRRGTLYSRRYQLEVLGSVVRSGNLGVFPVSPSHPSTVYQIEGSYPLGFGFEVRVEADVTINFAILGATGRAQSTSLNIAGTHNLDVTLHGRAGLGWGCAEGGLDATVDIVQFSLPFDHDLDLTGGGRYSFSSNYTYSTLEGRVELYGEACGLNADVTIGSWPPVPLAPSYALFNDSGCIQGTLAQVP